MAAAPARASRVATVLVVAVVVVLTGTEAY
jgi:FlaG/FlaF family flagellin (archaellin)